MVLIKNTRGNGLDPVRFYWPAPVMYYGEYDDYGGTENAHGSQIDLILEEFKTHSDWQGDIEHFSREGDAGQLTLADNEVDLIVIKQSVLDRFLEEYHYDEYYNDGPDDSGYRKIGYKYLCAQIPAYVLMLKNHMEKMGNDDMARFWSPLPEFDWDSNLQLGKFVTHFKDGHYTHPKNYFRQPIIHRLQEMAKNDDDEGLSNLLKEMITFALIHSFMNYSRRVFVRPMCSSQETDPKAQEIMARITLAVADEDQREVREDEEAWDPVRKTYISQQALKLTLPA